MEKFYGVQVSKAKFDGLDGRTTVTYTENNASDNPFKITCTAQGITLSGKMEKVLTSNDELQDFARLIAEAWKDHTRLKPRIITSVTDNG